jgi:hypothetical protein
MSIEQKNVGTRSSKHEGLGDDRRTARLGKELERSLSAYACAAAAAGVSLLAMTKSAEAKIVYTPADVKIAINGGLLPLDLNHDGITDFVFSNSFHSIYSFSSPSFARLFVGTGSGNTRNKIWGRGVTTSRGRNRFASALRPGFTVRANKSYFQKSPKAVMARLDVDYLPSLAGRGATYYYRHVSHTSGQWLYTQRRYLGLRFMIGGQVHYGWARVAVARTGTGYGKNSIVATLTGYAYETIVCKPIITGKTKGPDVITFEPASLGHLAQGASGILAWRRSGRNWESAAH